MFFPFWPVAYPSMFPVLYYNNDCGDADNDQRDVDNDMCHIYNFLSKVLTMAVNLIILFHDGRKPPSLD